MLGARIILAGLIAILVIGDAGAESKRQSPGTQQPVQTPSGQPTKPAAQDQRGTDQIPLSVKIVPGERTKEQAEKEERERREKDEKAAVDNRLTDQTQRLADETENLATYTRWLARFTLLLFFAAVGQIGLFVWQLRLIGKSLIKAEIAANDARASSDAAIAFERPYVRISKIKASIRGDVHSAPDHSVPDVFPRTTILRKPSATCTVENYGRTPAFLDATQAQFRFSADDLWSILEVGKPIPTVTLKTGQTYQFNVPLGEPITQQRAELIQSGEQHFWLHFNFIYRDVLGKTHQTPDKWEYISPNDSFSCITGAYREAT